MVAESTNGKRAVASDAGLVVLPKLVELKPEQRAELFLSEFRDACENADVLTEVLGVLKRGFKARTTIRVPDPESRIGWSYAHADDMPTQLVAAKVALAYMAGNPPSQADIRISNTGTPPNGKASLADRMAELQAIGVSVQQILKMVESETACINVTNSDSPAKLQ